MSFSKFTLAILLAVSLVSSSGLRGLLDEQPIKRPREVWVMRSILDARIRMLSIGLQENLWVAYSTQYGALYKAWTGDVKLSGAVFGKSGGGGQPTTQGIAYQEEPDANPWVIIKDGVEITPTVQYKGHTVLDNRITLTYELSYQGETIKLEEQPEYIPAGIGQAGFERIFRTEKVPNGVRVGLKMHLNSLLTEADFKTNGDFSFGHKQVETLDGRQFQAIAGTLRLKSNAKTTFFVMLTRKPAPAIASQAVVGEPDEVAGLLGKSDCNTCHNKTVKTIGPSFMAIAQRYQTSPRNQQALVAKIIKGGAGNWGEIPMTAHTEMSEADVNRMVSYILALDERAESELAKVMPPSNYAFTFSRTNGAGAKGTAPKLGIALNVYQLERELYGFPQLSASLVPKASGVANLLNAYEGDLASELKEFTRNYVIQASGFLTINKEDDITFRLASYFGSRLFIDDKLVAETKGNLAVVAEETIHLHVGKHQFRYEYFKRGGGHRFSLQWRPSGSPIYSVIPPEVFTYLPSEIKKATPKTGQIVTQKPTSPGDGAPLEAVHPSFTLAQARPDNFQPKISGMDFLPDGRLVVCTWDSLGAVYLLEGLAGTNPAAIRVKRIAAGLAEPLGLKVVDNEIYVLQKQELTKLVDLNNDDSIDEYRTVCNSWTGTNNHHEFAFGLVYKEGYFYGTLSVAVAGGGPSARNQVADRGQAFKISKKDGSIAFIANGLRTPNGIGIGLDNELFIADNQGDWLPANKIVHLQEGAFYGNRSVIDFDGKANLTETLPVVYLEHDKIGNSPSQPTLLNVGPYKNQLIFGDVTIGGIQRVFAEKVAGAYQGAVFMFSQGLEAGVNRLVWGPDGALYIGGIGNGGNWGQNGKLRYGLQKLTYNQRSTFEMLAVRARSNGIEIEFTEPLKDGVGTKPTDYSIRQWWYKPTANYGGPNLDEEKLAIRKVTLSADRRKAVLELAGMKEKHVVHIRLNKNTLLSRSGQKLWSTESWYTMNAIPGIPSAMTSKR